MSCFKITSQTNDHFQLFKCEKNMNSDILIKISQNGFGDSVNEEMYRHWYKLQLSLSEGWDCESSEDGLHQHLHQHHTHGDRGDNQGYLCHDHCYAKEFENMYYQVKWNLYVKDLGERSCYMFVWIEGAVGKK